MHWPVTTNAVRPNRYSGAVIILLLCLPTERVYLYYYWPAEERNRKTWRLSNNKTGTIYFSRVYGAPGPHCVSAVYFYFFFFWKTFGIGELPTLDIIILACRAIQGFTTIAEYYRVRLTIMRRVQ